MKTLLVSVTNLCSFCESPHLPSSSHNMSISSTFIVTTTSSDLKETTKMCITNKTKKCQLNAGDRPDLIQTEPVPSIGLARQTNYLSHTSNKTKKCQPDAGDRPDLIQTESVPSIGLARQTNYLSHTSTNDLNDNLPVANRLPVSRIQLSKELNSPVSLPVANKGIEDRHPDDKWLKDALIKSTKCQPAARDALSSGHTLLTVVVPVSCHTLPGHTLHSVVVPVSTGHTVHTLVPRVTVQVPVRPGHTVHTLVLRVTVQVPVGSHTLTGHTLHTQRVTVVVPVSHILSHQPHVLLLLIVLLLVLPLLLLLLLLHAKVPDSRLTRQQNKNQQNEKMKNKQTNYLSNTTTDDLKDNLPVANKLSISRIKLSKELNSPVYLSVASKFSEESVSHPDGKWLKDVQTKTKMCQPSARETLTSGQTLHTVVVPVSRHTLPGHTLHSVVVPVSTGHTVHTLVPRVTVQVPVRPGHTVHTLVPRVTVLVPVGSHTPPGHTLHSVVVTASFINIKCPDRRLARQQNKNKRNEKYKTTNSNYLSNVTVVNSVKLTKLYKHTQITLVTPSTLFESLLFILCESLLRSLSVIQIITITHLVIPFILCESLTFILFESLFRSLSVTTHIITSTQQVYLSQVSSIKSQVFSIKSQVHTTTHLVIPFILFESLSLILCESLFRSLSVTITITHLVIPFTLFESLIFTLCESLFRSLSVTNTITHLVIPFKLFESLILILCESLFRSLSVTTLTITSTQLVYLSQVSSIKSQVLGNKSQVHTITHLVIPFILFESLSLILCESLFRSLSVTITITHLVIPFTLFESLTFILCESLFRSLSVTSHTNKSTLQVPATVRSNPAHSPVTALAMFCPSNVSTVPCLSHIKSVHQVTYSHSISRKQRNNLIKQQNGNGKNTISVCHWNLGSKKWQNKRNQIQALVDHNKADLIFISEANLDESIEVYDSLIIGYSITLPKTVAINGTARLVLLTKNGLNFTVRSDLMEDSFSSIWVKISRPGVKSLLVCGLYREHQYLKQDSDWSLQPIEQNRRWSTFLKQVDTARISSTCHIIGDVNLDYLKWDLPDYLHSQMITDAKNCLEGGGFFQLVSDVTRAWPGQTDSLIDHFWTNDVQKVLEVKNSVRSAGDHNVITAIIRMKGSDVRQLDSRKRSFKNFDPVSFRQKLSLEQWEDIYEIEDVDLANDFIESRVVAALDEFCPYKTIQHRAECKTWLKLETKNKIILRDNMREQARVTNDRDHWKEYRRLRNEVNREVNRDKKDHYDNIYKKLYENKDVGGLYKTAKTQVGWTKSTSPTSFTIEGVKVTDPQSMADIQMKTFVNKTQKLLDELPPPTEDPCAVLTDALNKWPGKDAREIFEFSTVTRLDVLKILNELSNRNSSANDRLDSCALKHAAGILNGPITHCSELVNLNCQICS